MRQRIMNVKRRRSYRYPQAVVKECELCCGQIEHWEVDNSAAEKGRLVLLRKQRVLGDRVGQGRSRRDSHNIIVSEWLCKQSCM